jgi:hypothetical protein
MGDQIHAKFWWRNAEESVLFGKGEDIGIKLNCVFGKWVMRIGGGWNEY